MAESKSNVISAFRAAVRGESSDMYTAFIGRAGLNEWRPIPSTGNDIKQMLVAAYFGHLEGMLQLTPIFSINPPRSPPSPDDNEK